VLYKQEMECGNDELTKISEGRYTKVQSRHVSVCREDTSRVIQSFE